MDFDLHRNSVYGSKETVQKSLYYDHLDNQAIIDKKYQLELQKEQNRDYIERKKLDGDIERKLIETKAYQKREDLDTQARNSRKWKD